MCPCTNNSTVHNGRFDFEVFTSTIALWWLAGRASSHLVCDTHRKNSGESSTCVERYPMPVATAAAVGTSSSSSSASLSDLRASHGRMKAPLASSTLASASSQNFGSAANGVASNASSGSGDRSGALPRAHPASASAQVLLGYDAASATAAGSSGTSPGNADVVLQSPCPQSPAAARADGQSPVVQQETTVVNLSGGDSTPGGGGAQQNVDTELPVLDGDMSPGPMPQFNGVDVCAVSSAGTRELCGRCA